jgi:parallel beta-helix repeat protein
MRRIALVAFVLLTAVGFAAGQRTLSLEAAGTPNVASVNPASGPVGGGTAVTITGNNFTGCTTVLFGTAPASGVQVTSDTQITVTSPASPLPSPGTGTVDVFVGGTATCPTSPASPSDKFTYVSGGGGAGASFSGITYVVAPTGNDANTCILPTGSGSPDPSTFACATIQAAVNLTRDRDLVLVAQGTYDISTPIDVPDLIEIFAATTVTGSPATVGSASSGGQVSSTTAGCSGTGVKVILRSATGQPIFHVTGVGSPTLFPVISGFILGGTTSFINPGAIQLDGTSYAQVQCNIIGQEDLPNMIGVLLRNADNVFIHDNTIHGSTQFPISPVLGPTPPVGGFGIVTSECLGGGHSDDALILNNLIAFNSNAGVYFCSDGAGGHVILGNTVRSNGRGIVLREANDVIVAANAIQDNYYDGIELLETSTGNIITTNSIESQDGPNSSGVLLQGNGLLFPLNNVFTSNFFRRNTTNMTIIGARRTLIGVDKTVKNTLEGKFGPANHVFLVDPGNVMSADGERTDIVFSLGNPSGMALNSASPTFGQPTDTVIQHNTIQSNGPCNATRGCAIRLTAGVSADIDATQNEWGVTQNDEIRAEIWDKFHDSALGQVVIGTYTTSFLGTPPATPTLSPGYPPPPLNAPVPLNGGSVPPPNFPAPPASVGGAVPPPPTAYIDPSSGNYYVELTLCVTDNSNRPVPNDQLTVAVSDANSIPLGSANVSTNNNGCFIGDVAASGGGRNIQPANVSITDPSGAVTNLTVGAGSPLYRSPIGPVLSGR